ncbi:pentapeptide repeat-containing protein [Patescibacteria group bacterium]|nr:pentapeptide repeat-containing protein [Patescibacteria group bacterium]
MQYLDSALDSAQITGDFEIPDNSVLDFPWKNKEFRNAHVRGGSLTGSTFEGCSFFETDFENIALDHVDFIRCHFENFRIINCPHDGMEIRECTGKPPTIIGSRDAKPEL